MGNCPHDGGGAIDPAVKNFALVFIGPAVVANTGAGQVDNRIGAGHAVEVNGAGYWIPGDLIERRHRAPN